MPAGRTALLDAISRAIKELPLRPGDAIVVVGDGGENRSALHESDVRDLLTTSGVRVFGLLVYDPDFPTPEEMNGGPLMHELRDMTGGETADITPSDFRFVGKPPTADEKSSARLLQELTRVAMAVDHPLLLSVTWPLPAGGARPPKIRVEVVDQYGHRIKNLIVRYPERIVGCAPTSQAAVPAKPN